MSSAKEVLAAEFALLKADIIAAYEASGQVVSGNWSATVTAEPTAQGYSITAAGYLNGRKLGKAPPSEAIEQWIKEKGIASRLEKGMSVSSLAFLIARKIAREGWKPKPGTLNPVEAVVTPQRIQQMLDKVGSVYITDVTTQIINYLKQNAA